MEFSFLNLSFKNNNQLTTSSIKSVFMIRGSIEGFTDGVEVVLKCDSSIIDSTRLVNGKFKLKGEYKKKMRVLICIQYTKEFKFFSLNKNCIFFKAIKGNFENASIIFN